jgi:hypothetical protein
MNSGTSTDTTELGADAPHSGLQPWQFFVLAALLSATAALFLTRAQGVTAVVLLTMLIGSAALVGLAGLRMMRPLVSAAEDRTPMIGHRTREALEREKTLALRTLKELEFDRAMGKVSEADFLEMAGRLRARASRLIKQLDAGSGYRARIERDLEERLSEHVPGVSDSRPLARPRTATGEPARSWTIVVRVCGACQTQNESDARFCKSCGTKL